MKSSEIPFKLNGIFLWENGCGGWFFILISLAAFGSSLSQLR
jgi:hypothetical protein